ncbi:MAG TPA: phosphonate C-P lyase system protein PhnH [Alphaproteobacteria bacterium]
MSGSPPLDLGEIGPGFAEPVADAQNVFRLVLDAMAHPGRIVELPAAVLPANESGLPDAAAAVALTLLDFETPAWLDRGFARAADYLRFHCGAPIVFDSKASRFGFAEELPALPALQDFDLGSIDFPDRSTTLVLAVPMLEGRAGLTLRGPGIKDRAGLQVGGLTAAFWKERADLAALFPLGVDLVLACGRRLAAIPRTTTVEGF